MSTTVVTDGVKTRKQSASQDQGQNQGLSLDEVIRQNRARRAAMNQGTPVVQENTVPSSVDTGIGNTGGVSACPPITLGKEIWNQVFQGDNFVLPSTDFMKRL